MTFNYFTSRLKSCYNQLWNLLSSTSTSHLQIFKFHWVQKTSPAAPFIKLSPVGFVLCLPNASEMVLSPSRVASNLAKQWNKLAPRHTRTQLPIGLDNVNGWPTLTFTLFQTLHEESLPHLMRSMCRHKADGIQDNRLINQLTITEKQPYIG